MAIVRLVKACPPPVTGGTPEDATKVPSSPVDDHCNAVILPLSGLPFLSYGLKTATATAPFGPTASRPDRPSSLVVRSSLVIVTVPSDSTSFQVRPPSALRKTPLSPGESAVIAT